jgi:hypothetical protein
MKRLVLSMSVALAALTCIVLYAQAGAAPEAAYSVKAVGLQVVAPVPGEDQASRPFNSFPGVALSVLVRSPAQSIVAFDDDASRLEALQDDKGTDLIAKSEDSWQPPFGFPQISEDRKAVLFELRGNGLPAAGSARIRARGAAVLKVGTAMDTARQVNVPLRKGTKITAGPVPLTIKDVSVGEPMTLTLSADQELDAISDISFEDAAGHPIETRNMGQFVTRMVGRVSVEQQISFPKRVGSAAVIVKYWKDLQTVKVPVSVDVGLSLQ